MFILIVTMAPSLCVCLVCQCPCQSAVATANDDDDDDDKVANDDVTVWLILHITNVSS